MEEKEEEEEVVVARTFIINKVFSLLLFIIGLKHFLIFLLLLFLMFLLFMGRERVSSRSCGFIFSLTLMRLVLVFILHIFDLLLDLMHLLHFLLLISTVFQGSIYPLLRCYL